jgi:hypothetical protein
VTEYDAEFAFVGLLQCTYRVLLSQLYHQLELLFGQRSSGLRGEAVGELGAVVDSGCLDARNAQRSNAADDQAQMRTAFPRRGIYPQLIRYAGR